MYRDMKQDYVAEIMGTTKATISRLELGQQAYTQHTLEMLARIYGTTPGNLVDHDPRALFAQAPGVGLLTGLSQADLEMVRRTYEILRRNPPIAEPDKET